MAIERILKRRAYSLSRVKNSGLKPYPRGRRGGWGATVPEPQMDWGELRRIKMRCATECAEFNHIEGGCRFALLPSLECSRFRPGGFSEGAEESRPELVCIMSSRSKLVV